MGTVLLVPTPANELRRGDRIAAGVTKTVRQIIRHRNGRISVMLESPFTDQPIERNVSRGYVFMVARS